MTDQTHDFGLESGEHYEPPDIEESFDLGQPHVMTALGPIVPEALGLTLPHEHIISKPAGVDDPDLMLDEPAAALAELEDAYQVGLRSIVDMTVAGCGRDISDILWVAQRAPVHIILATGHHKHEFAAPFVGDAGVESIAEWMVSELTTGIDGTTARAGVITAGTSLNEITEVEHRILQATAITQQTTGVPISTHTERGTMALEQIDILRNSGANLSKVALGHRDLAPDEPCLRSVLDTGVFVSFNQVSKSIHAADTDRASMLKRLIDAGYLSQLLVSGNLDRRSWYLAHGGGSGFRRLVERFPLVLMEAGLTARQVHALYVENPARLLTIDPPAG